MAGAAGRKPACLPACLLLCLLAALLLASGQPAAALLLQAAILAAFHPLPANPAAGVCPGPALVAAIGAPSSQSLTIAGAMVGGMALHKHLQPLWDRLLGGAQTQAAAWEQAERRAERSEG